MLTVLMINLLGAGGLFPLPTVDGKALAVAEGQTHFVVPLRFEKVRAFYAEAFKDSKLATLRLTRDDRSGDRALTVTNAQKHGGWSKALVRETAAGTTIDVTPLIRLDAQEVSGSGKPNVEFIFGRSPAVDAALKQIGDDHVEAIRQ